MKERIREELIRSLFSYRTHILFQFDSNKVLSNAERMIKALHLDKDIIYTQNNITEDE